MVVRTYYENWDSHLRLMRICGSNQIYAGIALSLIFGMRQFVSDTRTSFSTAKPSLARDIRIRRGLFFFLFFFLKILSLNTSYFCLSRIHACRAPVIEINVCPNENQRAHKSDQAISMWVASHSITGQVTLTVVAKKRRRTYLRERQLGMERARRLWLQNLLSSRWRQTSSIPGGSNRTGSRR